jgi:GntR family transcriptional repressor for pyruvate dehydrogenase complex
MNEQRVKPQKGYEIVSAILEERIRSDALTTGTKLPSVVDLANSFGVGRSTIREALSALKARGLIDIQHGGGTFVLGIPPESSGPMTTLLFNQAKSLQQVMEVRQIVETGCVASAARNATSDDLFQLQAIVIQMSDALHDDAASEDADVRFHVAIAECTHNPILIDMMRSLMLHLQQTIRETRQLWFYAQQESAQRLLEEHRDIFQAIRDRSEDAAVQCMKLHLEKVDRVLQKIVRTNS